MHVRLLFSSSFFVMSVFSFLTCSHLLCLYPRFSVSLSHSFPLSLSLSLSLSLAPLSPSLFLSLFALCLLCCKLWRMEDGCRQIKDLPAPLSYPLRHPKYHLIETLIEVDWGGLGGSRQNEGRWHVIGSPQANKLQPLQSALARRVQST